MGRVSSTIPIVLLLLTLVSISMLPSSTLLKEAKAQTFPNVFLGGRGIDGNGNIIGDHQHTSSNSITFSWQITNPPADMGFSCTLFDGNTILLVNDCNGPSSRSITYTNLAVGDHAFVIDLLSAGQPVTGDLFFWTVVPPPTSTITSAVDGNNVQVQNGGTTASNSIKFAFTTTGDTTISPNNIAFTMQSTCTLDNGAPSPCNSPVTFTSLSPGQHQFSIQTSDYFGHGTKTSTPPFTWTILTPIQATQQLIQLTNGMQLASATTQALDSQLNAAVQYFQLNNKAGACLHLSGFATQVQTYLQVGKLTQAQASQLLQGVQSVEKGAGC